MSLLPDYAQQAATYDQTRAVSRPVLAALSAALAGAPGNRLADIGGGTGNYALALEHEGWKPVVIDRSPEMLALAARKGLATIAAAAERLPVADEGFDAAMLVSMLHHVADPSAALSEARRILRPGGRLVVMVFTREDIQDLWFFDHFPSTRAWMQASHLPTADCARGPSREGARTAMAGTDELLRALAARSSSELDAGLRQLESNINAGCAIRRAGRASILTWSKV